jgi:hypothetical protein
MSAGPFECAVYWLRLSASKWRALLATAAAGGGVALTISYCTVQRKPFRSSTQCKAESRWTDQEQCEWQTVIVSGYFFKHSQPKEWVLRDWVMGMRAAYGRLRS